LSEQKFGKQTVERARALANLGFIQREAGDKTTAEDTLEDSVNIYKKFPDLDKGQISNYTEALIALGYLKQERPGNFGESYFEQALKWREKSDGAGSAKTAQPSCGAR